jgi:hypothetical protein
MFITDTIYLSSARERKRNLGVAAGVHAAASAADAVGAPVIRMSGFDTDNVSMAGLRCTLPIQARPRLRHGYGRCHAKVALHPAPLPFPGRLGVL